MFKRKDPAPGKAGRESAAASTAPAAPDERDLKIERLERALAEEKAHSVTLREASDAQKFKLETLEKGYSKQLADARQRADVVTKELTELKAKLAQFGTGGEETLKKIEDMHSELLNVIAERNKLREQLAKVDTRRGGGYGNKTEPRRPLDESSDTINSLIKSAGIDPGPEKPRSGDSNANQRVKLEQASAEIMVSPDLIFTEKDKDDGDKVA
jgi:DNA repair exonuclease SbcCD ATPase subunit